MMACFSVDITMNVIFNASTAAKQQFKANTAMHFGILDSSLVNEVSRSMIHSFFVAGI